MKLVTLTRCVTGPQGTFGVLSLGNQPLCVTCEDPWRGNKKNVSCIPPGTYECGKFDGTRFKNVWEVRDVPNRAAILIHQGNTLEDTFGCILVGRSFGKLRGLPAVTNSLDAMEMLRKVLPDEFTLRITQQAHMEVV